MKLRRVIAKVISGGQTGADQAALSVAVEFGLPTGGTMPKGFLTHDGPRPLFGEIQAAGGYNMVEHRSIGYGPRTFVNAHDADITLRIAATFESAGEKLTAEACARARKPHVDALVTICAVDRGVVEFDVDPTQIDAAAARIVEEARRIGRPVVLNVAGNSEKTAKGIGAVARSVMRHVIGAICADDGPAPGT